MTRKRPLFIWRLLSALLGMSEETLRFLRSPPCIVSSDSASEHCFVSFDRIKVFFSNIWLFVNSSARTAELSAPEAGFV